MPTVKLTAAFVNRAAVEPGASRTLYWDEVLPGFGLAVTGTGHKSFVVQYRAGRGRQGTDRRLTIKSGALDVARREAKKLLGHVAAGGDPLAERRAAEAHTTNTLRSVTEDYFIIECGLKRDADGNAVFSGNKLRSAKQRLQTLERLVYPVLGAFPIADIERSRVVRLLDKIAKENGPVMADRTLAYLRRVFNWHVARTDKFVSPIVRGLARANGRRRDRMLDDAELRAVWHAAGDAGVFGQLVRFILLTGARRDEAAKMPWQEIVGATWRLPAARNKTKVDLIRPLPRPAVDLLDAMPRLAGCPYVFSNDGKAAIGGGGTFKAALQKASGTSGWTLHDLRRTSRSLMSRAGVPPDHAEHVLGHLLAGMRKVYDQHKYYDEKRIALRTLAGIIDRIVSAPADNVVALRSASEG
jgi:integrase